jgi:hypothetical protein
MDGAQFEAVVVLPFLLLGVALVAAFAWAPEPSSRPARPRGLTDRVVSRVQWVGAWFVLTVLTIWCGALVAFLVLHLLLFTLGQAVASVGLFVTVILLEVTPFAWAMVMLRRARRQAAAKESEPPPTA